MPNSGTEREKLGEAFKDAEASYIMSSVNGAIASMVYFNDKMEEIRQQINSLDIEESRVGKMQKKSKIIFPELQELVLATVSGLEGQMEYLEIASKVVTKALISCYDPTPDTVFHMVYTKKYPIGWINKGAYRYPTRSVQIKTPKGTLLWIAFFDQEEDRLYMFRKVQNV